MNTKYWVHFKPQKETFNNFNNYNFKWKEGKKKNTWMMHGHDVQIMTGLTCASPSATKKKTKNKHLNKNYYISFFF